MPSYNISEEIYLLKHEKDNTNILYSFNATAYTLIMVEKGSVTFAKDNKKTVLKPGEIIFIPKSFPENSVTTANYENGAEDNARICRFRFFPNVERYYYDMQIITPTVDIKEKFYGLNYNARPLNCTSLGEFFILLGEIEKLLKKNFSTNIEEQIHKAIDYMEINDLYNVPELAKFCGMSESRFYANFKAVTGMTPIEKKQAIQAEKAEVMLKTTNYTIEEICNKVGFVSMQHFRNVMRKRFNKTPTQVRKEFTPD